MALALISIAKYRERCIECVKLIISYNEQQILLDEEQNKEEPDQEES